MSSTFCQIGTPFAARKVLENEQRMAVAISGLQFVPVEVLDRTPRPAWGGCGFDAVIGVKE